MLQCWGAFCTALQREDATNHAEPSSVLLLLHSYLLTFEPHYGSWHRNLEPGQLLGSDIGKQVYVSIPRVTADQPWLQLYAVAVKASLERMAALMQGQRWTEAQEPLTMLFSLYALALLPHNLEVLTSLALAEPVLRVLEAATVAMRALSDMAPDARPPADDWPGYLCVTCGVCLRVFNCFFAPLHCWYRAWDAGSDERHALSLASHFGRQSRAVFLNDSPLLGLLRVWLGLCNDFDGCADMARLRLVVLETLGGLGQDMPRFPELVRQATMLDTLVSQLSWPVATAGATSSASPLSAVSETASPVAAVDDGNDLHLRLQIVTLRCISTCADGSVESATRLVQIGYVQGFLDVLLWASEIVAAGAPAPAPRSRRPTASGDDSDRSTRSSQRRSTSPTSPTSPASPERNAAADAAPLLYASVDEARAVAQQSPRSLPCPVVPPALLHPNLGLLLGAFQALVLGRVPLTGGGAPPNLHMITFVFDLFNIDVRQTPNNTRARTSLCVTDHAVAPQAHVLALVCDALQRFPGQTLRVLRKCCMWDALLSEFFFPRRALVSRVRAQLQGVVWGLLEYVGTLDRSNNAPEVRALFGVLLQEPAQPALIHRACEAFRGLFVCNAGATQLAVDNVAAVGEAISRLRFGTVPLPGSHPALCGLLRALALCFTLPRVRACAVSELGVVELLVQLVFDPLARPLTLDCWLTTMEDDFTDALLVNSFVRLFQQYVSLCERVRGLPDEHAFLLTLLAGVRRTVARKPTCVKVWRRVRVFDMLAGLLGSGPRLADLCSHVLETLTALMSHSGAAKRQFDAEVGFDKLAQLLMAVVGVTGSIDAAVSSSASAGVDDDVGVAHVRTQLLPLLFSMLVDGAALPEMATVVGAVSLPPIIRNDRVLHLLFVLWPALDAQLREEIVSRLLVLVHESAPNKARVCAFGLVGRLLEMVPDVGHLPSLQLKVMALVESLGAHSITPREMRLLLSLFRSRGAHGGTRLSGAAAVVPSAGLVGPASTTQLGETPPYWGVLLRSLHSIVTSPHMGPRYYFDMDGRSAAITLGNFVWPRSGFSFCVWIHPEALPLSSGAPTSSAPAYVFQLLPPVGGGGGAVELLYDRAKSTLVYRVMGEEAVLGPLKAGQWSHVVLAHRNAGLLVGRSEARLFVNGEPASSEVVVLPYPQFNSSGAMRAAVVGNKARASGSAVGAARVGFVGAMSAFFMFSEALTSANAAALHGLGPHVLGGVEHDVLRPGALVCAFNSVARNGKQLLDCSKAGASATITAAVVSAQCLSASDCFQCIGGVANALPLALQLGAQKGDASRADLVLIVEMLAALLWRSERNQRDMVACRGLDVLGHVLRGLPDHCACAESVESLLRRLGRHLQLAKLVDQNAVDVLVNFGFWSRATASVQQLYWTSMWRNYYAVDVSRWRHVFGVQALLDAMRLFEWHAEARVLMFKCVAELVAAAMGEDESAALVHFLLAADNDVLVLEGLHFVLHTLSAENRNTFLVHVSLHGGLVDVFVALFSSSASSVRLAALVLFSRLPLDDSPDFLERVGNVALRALSVWPLQLGTAAVLVSILVDRRTLPLEAFTDAENGITPQLLQPSEDGAGPVFRHVEALSILLGLLPRASLLLRATLLHDLSTIVLAQPENLDCVLRLPDWQLKLLRVLMETERDKTKKPEAAAAIGSNMSELFQSLFLRAFRTDPKAWELVQQTISMIAVHAQELAFARYSCSILAGLLQHLVSEARAVVTRQAPPAVLADYDRKRGNCVMPNIARVTLLVEEYLYYSRPEDVDQCVAECVSARASGVRSAPHPPRFSRTSALAASGGRQRTPSMGVRMAVQVNKNYVAPAEAAVPVAASTDRSELVADDSMWKDEALAGATMELLTTFSFHTEPAWPHIVDPAGLRPGGGRRLTLRLATDLLRYSRNRQVLEKTVLFLWSAFGKWAPNLKASDALPPEPVYVIGMLLATLRQRHSRRLDENGPDVGSIMMPLLRQLLRMVWPTVCAHRERSGLPVPDMLEQEEAKMDLGERNLDAGEFLRILERPHWRGLLDTVGVIVATHLGADTAFWIGIREQTLASLHGALGAVDRSVALSAAAENEFSERRLECERRRLAGERRRLDAVRGEYEAKSSKAARRAAVLMRELSRPGSAWALDGVGADDHWKRDKFETASRLRPKFKLNRRFDAHSDKGSTMFKPATAAAPSPPPPPPLEHELSSELKAVVARAAASTVHEMAPDAQQLGESAPTEAFNVVMDDTIAEAADEVTVVECLCGYIQPLVSVDGTLRLTNVALYFTSEAKTKKWPLGSLRELHLRRYLLRNSALEMFFSNNRSTLLNFQGRDREVFYAKLVGLRPPHLIFRERTSPDATFRSSNVTDLWLNHQISNMDYLMFLNTVAGRTYNDLGQYPVFPWVLSCYNEASVRLDDPACYRDLRKPVGALEPGRLESFLQRYRSFVDPEIPAFMYGSHYSNAGIVLYYLVRMEPYTTHHLTLQGGKFDQADRMFHSVPRTWVNVLTHSSDVKELIPEWYYQPEMFHNANRFQLGYRQNGEPLDDVELPVWCNGNADEFVRVNRAALESDYVSENLHHWIDLIFGYKQRGEAARDAANVFFHLTYGGSVDMDAITDLHHRRAVEEQVRHFGQVPAQLLRSAHPARKPLARRPGGIFIAPPLLPVPTSADQVAKLPTKFAVHMIPAPLSSGTPLVAVMMQAAVRAGGAVAEAASSGAGGGGVGGGSGERGGDATGASGGGDVSARFVTVDARRSPGCHQWSAKAPSPAAVAAAAALDGGEGGGGDATFTVDVDAAPSPRTPLGPPLAAGIVWSWRLVCVADEARLVVSGGHSDHSVMVVSLGETGSTTVQQRLLWHKDAVTVVVMDVLDDVLVTGSRDTTLAVWPVTVSPSTDKYRFAERPLHQLYGHGDEITCAAVRSSLDVVVSGARDGYVLIHELARGRLVHRLRPSAAAGPVGLVELSGRGHVVAYTTLPSLLTVYTINGRQLAQTAVHENVSCAKMSRSGALLVYGTSEGFVMVRSVYTLQALHKLRCASPIACLALSPDESNVLGAMEDGKILVVSPASTAAEALSPRSRKRGAGKK